MQVDERPARRPGWPIALAALLLAMVGASLGFYRVASRNPDALVVDDAYEAGRHESERLRAERHTEALGWRIELASEPRPDGVHVVVALRDAAGAPLAAERVSLRRERPAEGGLDADFALAGTAGGFAGDVPLPRPGRWHLVVRAERGGDVAERGFALWMP
jgi:nitrogen fixation protein FixH